MVLDSSNQQRNRDQKTDQILDPRVIEKHGCSPQGSSNALARELG